MSERIVLWDVASRRALDASIPLPAGATLAGAEAGKAGWRARSADAHYVFDADPRTWRDIACRLAGGPIAAEDWQRYVGDTRPYAPACR